MALRRGDDQYLSTVPDINPISVDDFIQQAQGQLPKQQPPLTNDPNPNPPPNHTPYGELPRPKTNNKIAKSKRRSKKVPKGDYAEKDLRAAVVKQAGPNSPPFTTLENAGHIGSATEYLDQQEAKQ
jgi:hypothetical protein